MHASCLEWVRGQVERHGLAGLDTLEVGSLDVNGSVRPLFDGPYCGVDFQPGPGVDVVMNAHRLRFPKASFDVVVSTEMLEHDSAFWTSLREMGRVLRPGGHLIVTARGNGMREHGFPHDYFRFMPQAREVLLELASCDVVELGIDPYPGVFLHGLRR